VVQLQLRDSEKACQHQLEVAQLRLATVNTRIDEFLISTKKCETQLTTVLNNLAERQKLLTNTMRYLLGMPMPSQEPAPADEEMASS
jgi:hypothetical protein